MRLTLPASVATWVLLPLAAWMLSPSLERHAVQREGVFVGLAALTLPHGLMLFRLRYLQRRSARLSSHTAH